MKKTAFMRVLAVALVAMSIMAVSVSALAESETVYVAPNQRDEAVFDIYQDTSFYVYLPDSVPAGSKVTVELSYYDNNVETGDPWKETDSVVLVKGGNNSGYLIPTAFHYVSGRTPTARVLCKASPYNTVPVTIIINKL